MTKIFGNRPIETSTSEIEETLREQESLQEKTGKLLKAILSVVAYGQNMSNNEEDYS